jgi:hypothetical protein
MEAMVTRAVDYPTEHPDTCCAGYCSATTRGSARPSTRFSARCSMCCRRRSTDRLLGPLRTSHRHPAVLACWPVRTAWRTRATARPRDAGWPASQRTTTKRCNGNAPHSPSCTPHRTIQCPHCTIVRMDVRSGLHPHEIFGGQPGAFRLAGSWPNRCSVGADETEARCADPASMCTPLTDTAPARMGKHQLAARRSLFFSARVSTPIRPIHQSASSASRATPAPPAPSPTITASAVTAGTLLCR